MSTFEGTITTARELQSAGELQDDDLIMIAKSESSELYKTTLAELKRKIGVDAAEGWIEAKFGADFEAYTNGEPPIYRKKGDEVTVIGVVKPTATIKGSSTEKTIFTLPAGYRPLRNIYRLCQGSGNNKWLLSIKTDGVVSFSRYGTSAYADCSASAWLPFYEKFPVS